MKAFVSALITYCIVSGVVSFTAAAPSKWDITQWRSSKFNQNPIWLSPAIQFKAEDAKWLSIKAKSIDTSVGMVYWSTTDSAERKSILFHMKPDGITRVYSVNLGNSEDWKGTIKTLGIGMHKEMKAEFYEAELLSQPVALPEIEATFFGLRDYANKANTECVLHAAIRNIGGKSAANFQVSAAIGNQKLPPVTVPSLAVNDVTTLSWPFRAGNPGTYTAVLEVSGGGMKPTTVTTEVEITALPLVQPTLEADGKPYVPKPERVASDYDVGVYYYPGWSTYTSWSVLDNYPEKRPVLGYYKEGDPQVSDWHLKWAAEHGINFFIYDWYWEDGGRHSEHALHEGYLHSKYQSEVKFALLWANHNQPGTSSEEDLMQVTQFWLKNYFKLPNYYKVNGKPLIIIFSPDRLTEDMGAANVKTAIRKMRDMVQKAGIPDLYMMACAGPDPKALRIIKEEGYDAVTGYNYPSAGASSSLYAPYDTAVSGYASIWRQMANTKTLDCVPVTDPGWDSRPWAGEQALNRYGRSPEKFKVMLEKAKAFVDDKVVEGRKIVLVEAWNEFGEGAAVEPHKQFGFGYLDAIRSVFASAPAKHDDITPVDVGLGPYELSPPPPGYSWDFSDAVGSLGWGKQNTNPFGVKDGLLQGVSTNSDPGFYSPKFKLEAIMRSKFTVKMKIDQGERAQIFWSTTEQPISEQTSIRFDVIPDNEFHEYTVWLDDNAEWDGIITQLRLDPCDAKGAGIAVEYIRLDQ